MRSVSRGTRDRLKKNKDEIPPVGLYNFRSSFEKSQERSKSKKRESSFIDRSRIELPSIGKNHTYAMSSI